MQSPDLINNLQARYPSTKAPATADSSTAVRLEPGQRIQATIQAQLGSGQFKVQIAGQTLQISLPGQFKNGTVVQLQVLTNTPNLTFSLLAQNAPAAATEQLSTTSRFLANLTELPLAKATVQSASGSAVWPATGGAIDSKQLALALHDALGNSGLFYESHQAQWVRGERSTAQLLIEPQNQWRNQDASTAGQQADKTAILPDKTAADSGLPVSKELMTMVQLQLHTLETHQLTWTGNIWPGQQMQWEIEGEPEHNPRQSDERRWSTEMELALPKLGDVHARLVFTQGGIMLKLHAAGTDTIALFQRNLPDLARTLADAGVPLTAATVEKS